MIAGGKKLKGTMFQPTVLANVPNDCVRLLSLECPKHHSYLQLLTAEETFGPLAALIKFKTEDEVVVRHIPGISLESGADALRNSPTTPSLAWRATSFRKTRTGSGEWPTSSTWVLLAQTRAPSRRLSCESHFTLDHTTPR